METRKNSGTECDESDESDECDDERHRILLETFTYGRNKEQKIYQLHTINIQQLNTSGLEACRGLSICSEKVRVLDISSMPLLETVELTFVEMDQFVAGHHQNLLALHMEFGSVASFDASQMPRLRTLCIERTEIDNLDVSSLRKLEVLRCRTFSQDFTMGRHPHMRELVLDLCYVAKTDFDVSEMPKLTELDLNLIRIENLHTGTHPHLEKLKLETICVNLDITGMPNLRCLDILKTDIEHLDMPQLTQLQVFRANERFSGFDITLHPNLRELTLGGREVTFLDFSAVPELQALEVHDSAISELDITQLKCLEVLKIGKALQRLTFSPSTHLRVLWVVGCKLPALDISALPELKAVEISSSSIRVLHTGRNSAVRIFRINYTQIRRLDLRWMRDLWHFSASNSQLRYCDLRNAVKLSEMELEGTGIRFMRLTAQRWFNAMQIGTEARRCDFSDIKWSNCTDEEIYKIAKQGLDE